MSSKKIIIFGLIIYGLILFQSSFLVPFVSLRRLPSLAIIFVLFLNIREKPSEGTASILSFFTGLLLDAFSSGPFGLFALIFLTISVIIKFFLGKYIRWEMNKGLILLK
ncbi:MAG: rod shape-determining protein MreD [Candidatus Nealsonbacteria bacterium]|nr:rod shape-determining protein MreD [Candidatus Nealsonbacteria bacterium]